MTFGQPLMLWGMLAAAVPLLIHLFDRRRPRPQPFGPIAWVLKSQKRTARRLKLKRILLYTLRTLLLLAIPLALARPELRSRAEAAPVAKGPAATAIVLDASLSMRYRDGGQSLFARAQDEARGALRALRPEEPATVLVCTDAPAAPGAPGFDRARLRGMIDDAEPTYAPANVGRCLELAARALEDSPLPGKRLVLVSDLTQASLPLDAPPPRVKGPDGREVRPEVVLRDAAGGKAALPNHGLVDLKVEPAPQAGPRSYAFTFTVRNFGPTPLKDLPASVKVGEATLAKGFVDVPAGGAAQKSLTVRFPQGGTVAGEVALEPDALAEDDARAFVLPVPKPLEALVVNGAPHATRYRDEAFFVQAALDAPGSPVEAQVRDAAAGLREDLAGYDVVLLLNVPAPDAEAAQKLERFVEGGGGLFISVGDQVDPEAYNARLGGLLPRKLRLVRTAAERNEEGEPVGDARPARLGRVDLTHPLFAPFAGRAGEGLHEARFWRYMLLEAQQGSGGVLATYEDGAPALAVTRKGKGRVALLTTTADRDWADLAIRTSFLPLLQRCTAFLAGALEEREEVRARVGDTVTLRPDTGQQVGSVRGPANAEPPHKPQPDGTVRVGPVRVPGTYAVLDTAQKPLPALGFPVTLDPSESDLTRLSADALQAYFGEEAVAAARAGAEKPPVPLWTWLIAAAVACFFLEGVLLRR